MIERMNEVAINLPRPKEPDPNAASAVQELLGGRYGEMSTFNNYLFQSFNFKNKKKLKPFYDLIASITAEEFGHLELVAHTINILMEGSSFPGEPDIAPLRNGKDLRNHYAFIDTAQSAKPGDSQGRPWTGDNVFNSGNLIVDLLHNYFLEIGARTHKMRVYEMTSHPTAREMIGYLLVRGGTHIVAYAKALEVATGVDITKMLPVPTVSNRVFDTARKFEEKGAHRKLYTFSKNDYRGITQIWKGTHPETNEPLEVIFGSPKGAPVPDYEEVTEEFAPGISMEDFQEIAKRLQNEAGLT
ncbi:manganese catalase family protein [Fervidibacillus albus]|uniref:Manganese catalase family protein n=2 Tax=Fervidibacillus albus TaxID=2980026 RepID=A0A9E8LWC3_9BACI|nr:manganese catalase family protein [Fervidibacillus albus]WAA10913.1 manganese catalase family protein [Fervidibacillus albus]